MILGKSFVKAYKKGKKRFHGRVIPLVTKEICEDPSFVRSDELSVHGHRDTLRYIMTKKAFSLGGIEMIAEYKVRHNDHPGFYIATGIGYRSKNYLEMVADAIGFTENFNPRMILK